MYFAMANIIIWACMFAKYFLKWAFSRKSAWGFSRLPRVAFVLKSNANALNRNANALKQ